MNNTTFGANNIVMWGNHGGVSNHMPIPFVIEKTSSGEKSYDISSRLLEERIIQMTCGFDSNSADVITKCMMYLDSLSRDDITWVINSGGGVVHDGLAIHDTMESLECDVITLGKGICASMGAYSLIAGTPGKRVSSQRNSIMIHQVSAGNSGHYLDMEASMGHTRKLNEQLMQTIADNVGMSLDELLSKANRDLWLTPMEALNFGTKGCVDHVMTGRRNSKGQFEVVDRHGKYSFLGGKH